MSPTQPGTSTDWTVGDNLTVVEEVSGPGSRRLIAPTRPTDDGSADEGLTAALTAYATDPGRFTDALLALRRSRLLVPVVAVLGEVSYDAAGLAHDKSSDMAAVLLTGADGRLALLAFTATEALAAWDPDARPVPVEAPYAARAAVQEGAAALVVDVAGPVPFVVEGEDLMGLAAGWTLAWVHGRSVWIRPDGE